MHNFFILFNNICEIKFSYKIKRSELFMSNNNNNNKDNQNNQNNQNKNDNKKDNKNNQNNK